MLQARHAGELHGIALLVDDAAVQCEALCHAVQAQQREYHQDEKSTYHGIINVERAEILQKGEL